MTTTEKNELFTKARQQLRIALMMADSMAENPTVSLGEIQRLTNMVAAANSAVLIFNNACVPMAPRGEATSLSG